MHGPAAQHMTEFSTKRSLLPTTCDAESVGVSEPTVIFLVLYSMFGLLYVFCYGGSHGASKDSIKVRPKEPSLMRGVESRFNLADASEAKRKKMMEMKRLFFHNRRKSDGSDAAQGYETDYSSISFKEKIGTGTYGEVYRAIWKDNVVAVKTIASNYRKNEVFMDEFKAEINLLSELHHPNIVTFLGASLSSQRLCIILEYCAHGNLQDFYSNIDVHKIELSMRLMLKMALDVARGVNYLHQKKHIIQRDIKGRNILIDDDLNAKLTDFGASKKQQTNDAANTMVGTPAWTAPEIVRGKSYTEKVDVYSFGVLLWELVLRREPYSGVGGIQVAYAAAGKGVRPDIPDYVPPAYKQLMEDCWEDDPTARPGFPDILNRLFNMLKDEADPKLAPLFYFGPRRSACSDIDLSQIESLLDGKVVKELRGVAQQRQTRIERWTRALPSGSKCR